MAKQHVCPWWLAFSFDNPVRLLFHNRDKILGPYVKPGNTAVDIGCGMGYNTIGLARLVGPGGRVVAVDIQEKMLNTLTSRVRSVGLDDRIEPRLADAEGQWALQLAGRADFIVTFWMVHEVPDIPRLFAQIRGMLKEGGKYLLAEPKIHVRRAAFKQTLDLAESQGLQLVDKPGIRLSYAALFRK